MTSQFDTIPPSSERQEAGTESTDVRNSVPRLLRNDLLNRFESVLPQTIKLCNNVTSWVHLVILDESIYQNIRISKLSDRLTEHTNELEKQKNSGLLLC